MGAFGRKGECSIRLKGGLKEIGRRAVKEKADGKRRQLRTRWLEQAQTGKHGPQAAIEPTKVPALIRFNWMFQSSSNGWDGKFHEFMQPTRFHVSESGIWGYLDFSRITFKAYVMLLCKCMVLYAAKPLECELRWICILDMDFTRNNEHSTRSQPGDAATYAHSPGGVHRQSPHCRPLSVSHKLLRVFNYLLPSTDEVSAASQRCKPRNRGKLIMPASTSMRELRSLTNDTTLAIDSIYVISLFISGSKQMSYIALGMLSYSKYQSKDFSIRTTPPTHTHAKMCYGNFCWNKIAKYEKVPVGSIAGANGNEPSPSHKWTLKRTNENIPWLLIQLYENAFTNAFSIHPRCVWFGS